jgi:hypothetical protein
VLVLASLTAISVLVGCGQESARMPAVCTQRAETFVAALQRAPGAVALPGGTRISTCVERAVGPAQSQNLGFVLVTAAEREVRDAVRLGFLVGAVHRGASKTNGVMLELERRLKQVAGVNGPSGPRRAAYLRGLAAGEDHG